MPDERITSPEVSPPATTASREVPDGREDAGIPSTASRLLGAASLLAALWPLASCFCISAATQVPEIQRNPRVGDALRAAAKGLMAAPAAGLALALAALRGKGRRSGLATAGLMLNLLWLGFCLVCLCVAAGGCRGRAPEAYPW